MYCLCLIGGTVVFKVVQFFYWQDRGRERIRIFFMLANSPNTHSDQVWARLQPGAQSSTRIIHRVVGALVWNPSSTVFQDGLARRQMGSSDAGAQTSTAIWDTGFPKMGQPVRPQWPSHQPAVLGHSLGPLIGIKTPSCQSRMISENGEEYMGWCRLDRC